MTTAIITALVVMAIALVVFILIADRGFMALGDRLDRHIKDSEEILSGVATVLSGHAGKFKVLQKKMKDDDPHHKIDIIFDKLETLWKRGADMEVLEDRLDDLLQLRDTDTRQALAVIDDFEKKLSALVLQISKKNAQNAETLSTLADEVSALRQMRGAKR